MRLYDSIGIEGAVSIADAESLAMAYANALLEPSKNHGLPPLGSAPDGFCFFAFLSCALFKAGSMPPTIDGERWRAWWPLQRTLLCARLKQEHSDARFCPSRMLLEWSGAKLVFVRIDQARPWRVEECPFGEGEERIRLRWEEALRCLGRTNKYVLHKGWVYANADVDTIIQVVVGSVSDRYGPDHHEMPPHDVFAAALALRSTRNKPMRELLRTIDTVILPRLLGISSRRIVSSVGDIEDLAQRHAYPPCIEALMRKYVDDEKGTEHPKYEERGVLGMFVRGVVGPRLAKPEMAMTGWENKALANVGPGEVASFRRSMHALMTSPSRHCWGCSFLQRKGLCVMARALESRGDPSHVVIPFEGIDPRMDEYIRVKLRDPFVKNPKAACYHMANAARRATGKPPMTSNRWPRSPQEYLRLVLK